MRTARKLRARIKKDMIYREGKLIWKQEHSRGGREVGYMDNGYRKMDINQTKYTRAQLVVLWFTGKFPTGQVRHKNGERCDDRYENLRWS